MTSHGILGLYIWDHDSQQSISKAVGSGRKTVMLPNMRKVNTDIWGKNMLYSVPIVKTDMSQNIKLESIVKYYIKG